MPFEICRISWAAILSDPSWPELLAEYGAECSIPEIGKPDPQPELYALMERSGMMQDFGAYEDGRLIGFASIQAFTLPHYGRKIANVESLFVPQAHRHTGVGLSLLRTARVHASQQGCVAILYNAPAGSNFERLLNARKQARRTNAVFCEAL